MAEQSTADKQYLAKILFTREKLDQKTIAKRVGVSEKTMSKWVNDFNWRALRDHMLVGKEQLMADMYEQLAELNEAIKSKPKGQRYADSKQGDVQVKLTASIRSLETDLAIADIVDSGIKFIKFLQGYGTHQQVMEFSELWNAFINAEAKK